MKQEFINDGFPPIIDESSVVLILGSFPSVKSREVGFYYGNPQNRFWKMLSAAVGKSIPDNIEEKKVFLKENKIALWDVIDKSNITGSSDGDLKTGTYKAVEIDDVLKVSKNLKLIICNGKKSYEIFNNICKNLSVNVICMPSTSSANPRYDQDLWLNTLNKIL